MSEFVENDLRPYTSKNRLEVIVESTCNSNGFGDVSCSLNDASIADLRAALAAYDAEQTSGDASWAIARMKEGKFVRPMNSLISFRFEGEGIDCYADDRFSEDEIVELFATALIVANVWHITNNDFAKP